MATQRPKKSAAEFVPKSSSLSRLRDAVSDCHGCDLYKNATHGVFGEGPRSAKIMIVGEQPGDKEDLAGRPFVGPSGSLLDHALEDAGISRDEVYITNAVKHFKWKPVGKRRLHQKPNSAEVRACRPWLDAEVKLIAPEAIVCMGATAAEAVFAAKMPVLANRGRWMESAWSKHTLITVHPSSILRAIDPPSREREYRAFVEDLRVVARFLGGLSRPPDSPSLQP